MRIAQIKVQKTLPINPDKNGTEPSLTRDQVWEGLLLKVYDARPFVPLMTRCEVTEELENGIVREIIFDNMGAVINTKESSNGKYTSVSVSVKMKNPDHVIEKYKEVGEKIEGVISL